MRTFVSSSLALAALLAAGPVLAQAQAAKPDAGAAVPAPGRSVSATGRTMPKPRNAPAEAAAKPTASEAEMLKAQKASEDPLQGLGHQDAPDDEFHLPRMLRDGC